MKRDESIVLKTISRERLEQYFKGVYWYHFIDTGLGTVTSGAFDYKDLLDKFHFPESLEGKTVLDVGASNGYFSFLFEKMGAKKVLAIDTDNFDGSLPIPFSPRLEENYKKKYSRDARYYEEFKDVYDCLGLKGSNNLLVLADIFRSKVEWKNHSVYELDKLNEKFDFVFCGAMIEHLKNPVEGVEQLCKATKQLCVISLSNCLYWWPMNLISKTVSKRGIHIPFLSKTVLYYGNVSGGSFFHFNPLAFKELLLASGFARVEIVSFFKVRNQKRSYVRYSPHAIFHCYK